MWCQPQPNHYNQNSYPLGANGPLKLLFKLFWVIFYLILAVFTFALVTLHISLDWDVLSSGAGHHQAINPKTLTH